MRSPALSTSSRRTRYHSSPGSVADINRDGRVNVLDLALVRGNMRRVLLAPREPVVASVAASVPGPTEPRRRPAYVPLRSQVLII